MRRKTRGRGSQQGRAWPCVVCCGSCVHGWCMRVLECFCVYICLQPTVDSGTCLSWCQAQPALAKAQPFPSSQELRFTFLWRQHRMNIMKSSSKSGPRCAFARTPGGEANPPRVHLGPMPQQLEGCTLHGYKYLPEHRGVSEFGREHASPLSQQQISSLWWAARLFHKSGRGCPFRGYLCCIGQLASLAGFNLHDLAR